MKNTTKVAMFVTNPCTHDARVMKEARTLSENGYEVRVFALANAYNPEGVVEQEGYTVHRLKFDSIFQRARKKMGKLKAMVKASVSSVFATLFRLIYSISAAIAGAIAYLVLFPIRLFKQGDGEDYAALKQASVTGMRQRAVNLLRRSRRLFRVTLDKLLRATVSFHLRLRIRRLFRLALIKPVRLVKKIFRKSFAITKLVIRRVRSKAKRLSINFINRSLMPFHKLSTYYFFCQMAADEAIVWGAEIAHAHDLNTMLAGKKVKGSGSGIKLVYDSHELWIHRNRVGREGKLEKALDSYVEKKLIYSADAIITVCDSIGVWLSNRYGQIPTPWIVKNTPYALDVESASAHSEDLKQRLKIPASSVALVYTGKFTTGRGITIGLEMVSKIDNLHLVMLGYGEPSYVQELEGIIRDNGIEKRVHICDPVPFKEVPSFLQGADLALVYIEPICLSYEYALPNKLFESIQAGVPILGASLVEIKKTVESNDIGLSFTNVDELEQKLGSINQTQVAKWKENLASIRTRFCWEQEAKVLLDCYRSIT